MNEKFTKTKIITTLGPATSSVETIRELVDEGVDVFRINMSHMSHDKAANLISIIRKISSRVAILVDLQGPKIRLTSMTEAFEVQKKDILLLKAGEEDSSRDTLFIPFAELIEKLEIGHHLLIDDGLVRVQVIERIDSRTLKIQVINGGKLSGRKGVSAPDLRLIPEQYLEKDDKKDILFAAKKKVDFIAASFVSRAEDVDAVRREFLACGGDESIQIIAKIESRVGVENIQSILDSANGIMVARGDLGVEIPPEEVPLIQKTIIRICNSYAKPVIVATQMLESMVQNPIASRAETSDVANAILDGTDCVMLSAETSVGKYPIKAVQTLNRISEVIEASEFENRLRLKPTYSKVEFLCESIAKACRKLPIKAIVAFTSSGFTARNVSSFRPRVPIFAICTDLQTVRTLNIHYGVYGVQAEHIGQFQVMLHQGLQTLLEKELLEQDDLIAIIGGIPVGKTGSTNTFQIETVKVLMEDFD